MGFPNLPQMVSKVRAVRCREMRVYRKFHLVLCGLLGSDAPRSFRCSFIWPDWIRFNRLSISDRQTNSGRICCVAFVSEQDCNRPRRKITESPHAHRPGASNGFAQKEFNRITHCFALEGPAMASSSLFL